MLKAADNFELNCTRCFKMQSNKTKQAVLFIKKPVVSDRCVSPYSRNGNLFSCDILTVKGCKHYMNDRYVKWLATALDLFVHVNKSSLESRR